MGALVRSSLGCPHCGSRRGYAIYSTNTYCFKCNNYTSTANNFSTPVDTKTKKIEWTGELPNNLISDISKWPYKFVHYLSQFFDDLQQHSKHFLYSPTQNRLVIPIYYKDKLMCYQARSIDREPKWLTVSPLYPWGKKFPFIHITNGRNRVVLVEDITSAIKLHAKYSVIALLGCNANRYFLNFLLDLSDDFIIWLDGDDAGKKGTESLLHQLSLAASVTHLRTEKDPKCYSHEAIKLLLKDVAHD